VGKKDPIEHLRPEPFIRKVPLLGRIDRFMSRYEYDGWWIISTAAFAAAFGAWFATHVSYTTDENTIILWTLIGVITLAIAAIRDDYSTD